MVVVRALTVDDLPLLAAFACARLDEPLTEVVQRDVRQHLAADVTQGRLVALGLFEDDGQLRGVAAYQRRSLSAGPIFRTEVVAVAVGGQRRGYGRMLKEAVISEARRAGAVAVDSRVHRANTAMLQLNRALGAVVADIDGEPDHVVCVIPLR